MAKLDQITINGTTYEIVPEIAPLFDATKAYAVGDCVIKDAVLYRFTVAHAAGAWIGTDAEEVTVGEELTNLKADLKLAGTNLFSLSDMADSLTNGSYIPTGAVGATINPEVAKSDSNMCHVIFPVNKGDAVKINGYSKTGSDRRFYNVTDTNYKVIASGATGGALRDVTISITVDGYVVVNIRSDLSPKTILHQSAPINSRLLTVETNLDTVKTGFDAFAETPELFRFSQGFLQGEFGGFANVTYAMKLNTSVQFDYDVMLYVPEGFGIVIRYVSSGSRVRYDNYVWISKGTSFTPAILYAGELQSQTMTEDVARTNLYYTKPVSYDNYKDTFCSPGIFGEFAIIGDSYSLGSMHWDNNGYKGYPQYSWGKLMCKRHGNNCTLYSHGGYGIQRWLENILSTVLSDDPKDFYWWGLGINDADDARIGTNVGSLEDLNGGDWTQYPDTLYGMYAKAYEQVAAHAPLAKHVFVSCIKETPNHRWTSYKAINTLLKNIADHYGVPFIDLVNDPFYVSKFYIDEVMTGHPTLIGYGGMSYANERLLNRCIADNVSYFRFYGRTNNPDDTDPT